MSDELARFLFVVCGVGILPMALYVLPTYYSVHPPADPIWVAAVTLAWLIYGDFIGTSG